MHDLAIAAEKDLRALHRELRKHLSRYDEDEGAFHRTGRSGMSAAALHSHLAAVAETVIVRLRLASTQVGRLPEVKRSARQAAALRWALLTWQVRAGPLDIPLEIDVVEPGRGPAALVERHTRWVGDFLALLEGMPQVGFQRVSARHPQFGAMTVAEWARYLRIYARAKELEFCS